MSINLFVARAWVSSRAGNPGRFLIDGDGPRHAILQHTQLRDGRTESATGSGLRGSLHGHVRLFRHFPEHETNFRAGEAILPGDDNGRKRSRSTVAASQTEVLGHVSDPYAVIPRFLLRAFRRTPQT